MGSRFSTLLVGDIGGTNARFALATLAPDQVRVHSLWKREARGFPSFGEALAAFCADINQRLDGAALGVAGPVIHNRVDLTNGDWIIDGAEAADRLGGAPVLIANDFEAMARSAPELGGSALESISPGKADSEGALAIVGPGTGLGVGALKRLRGGEDGWIVVGGEGGHQAFAPQTELEWRLAESLRARHGYVSNELIASGSGLETTLAALAGAMDQPAPGWSPAEVQSAAEQGEALAQELMRLRARTVMTALGDHALAVKATGGAYVAGGVGVRLAAWLKHPEALDRFYRRGAQAPLLASVPIWLIRDETAPLIGAATLWRDWRARGWM